MPNPIFKIELIAMIQLGVLTAKADYFECWEKWCAVIDDKWLQERCKAWGLKLHTSEGFAEALKRLTKPERIALRDRVVGVVPCVPPAESNADEVADEFEA